MTFLGVGQVADSMLFVLRTAGSRPTSSSSTTLEVNDEVKVAIAGFSGVDGLTMNTWLRRRI
ncbi:MAG: hypothetical protein U5K43_10110 [Halofilum sp. (in: g-proteobacteria)]|nr:hypothetical protein [Halofilum sp. (in: g-proteobacteria)]